MKHPFEQIEEQYKKLPSKLQDILSSPKTLETLQTIANDFKLQIDETGELVDETGLVILGLTNREDYASNLEKRLKVSNQVAQNIAKNINEKVFMQIIDLLKKNQEKVNLQQEIPTNLGVNFQKNETTPEPKEENLNRDTLLKEIEDSSIIEELKHVVEIPKAELKPSLETYKAQKTEAIPEITEQPEKNLAEEKLNGVFKSPKEEIEIKEEIKNGEKILSTDPYREPIE
ncbi:hypothetical protein ACFLY7_00165 [Patescibacteria group bacterium]